MSAIKASIGTELYKIEIKSTTGNIIIADEPVDKGGQDKGFSPKELLVSALGACTCATLRMYADRKGWELEKAEAEIELSEENGQTKFIRKLLLSGKLDDEQRTRLLAVANACPIHKILTHSIVVETVLA
ncbi:OsmC family protein [Pedobacter psychroterrae]|uniref:OsmC family peroxiredoxin n=1 Tax=Pedobacter psychroterrae TaxID=2530453 RepID=A0A4R0NUY9_9SPHI|nr:OsmC family protein [Pedobacter psychroterrae]TCD02854.1 OsmC family peroxiredoxin [Pedobacter psychroterrae]